MSAPLRLPRSLLRSLRGRQARLVSARVSLMSCATAGIVPALGGGEAFWLCVPAALMATAGCRTRIGTTIGAALVTLAAMSPSLTRGATVNLPPLALALIVPAASVAVMVALRERLEAEREEMRLSALTDPLTGIANRRSLLARMQYEIARHNRTRRPFGVLVLDLDGFKQLNDRFGHPAGDDLLRDVTEAISQAIRDQDTIARMGGDEFCVLAPETDIGGVQQLAARVLASVRTVTAGIEALGASAGIATFPLDGKTTATLLETADTRLLEAKRRRGRGRARQAA